MSRREAAILDARGHYNRQPGGPVPAKGTRRPQDNVELCHGCGKYYDADAEWQRHFSHMLDDGESEA